MKELHLVLKHKWFDLFERGIKPEEYRERTPYWKKRIFDRRGEIDTLTLQQVLEIKDRHNVLVYDLRKKDGEPLAE